jgi:hypothetical protein
MCGPSGDNRPRRWERQVMRNVERQFQCLSLFALLLTAFCVVVL